MLQRPAGYSYIPRGVTKCLAVTPSPRHYRIWRRQSRSDICVRSSLLSSFNRGPDQREKTRLDGEKLHRQLPKHFSLNGSADNVCTKARVQIIGTSEEVVFLFVPRYFPRKGGRDQTTGDSATLGDRTTVLSS
ncbi:hypothetical protein J6590_022614 [Homalodisca vitripennis]|nr:hypothetical protein J6590_022614 [Homalodisca vitripennis]